MEQEDLNESESEEHLEGGEGEFSEEESDDGISIEISALSIYTHTGVTEAERELGQRLVIDLRLELERCEATVTDRIEDTVDYGEVSQTVWLIAQQRSYHTLERLVSAVADRLLSQYPLESVWIKAAKPEPPLPLSVGSVAVELWREAESISS